MAEAKRIPTIDRRLALKLVAVLALVAALIWGAWVSRELSAPRQHMVTVRLAETIAAFVDAEARGSLIFFAPPQSPLIEAHFGTGAQLFGKRVLGVPGDVVSHQGNAVFINGRKVAERLGKTRLGIELHQGPSGPIPEGCYYTGTAHPRGLDSRYAEIGWVCRPQIIGSGRAIL